MNGFERQPTLWGPYQRSRCVICQGKSEEASQAPFGDRVLDRWEESHAKVHAAQPAAEAVSGTSQTPTCRCGYEDDDGPTGPYWKKHVAIWPQLRHGVPRRLLTIREDWVIAYQAGTKIPTIAREHNTWPDVVRRHLTAAGVQLRDDRTTASRLPNLDLARAERLHAAGHTWKDVADLLGVGLSTLHQHRQEAS